MKKAWAVAILILLCLAVPGGCRLQERAAANPQPPNGNGSRSITLKLWHIWTTDVDANRITLEAGLDAVQKAYPDIHFEVDATENQTYKTRIKTAIAVNDTPDIFFSWGGGFSESFIQTGKVLCLDPYYTPEVQRKLPREYLQYQIYDGSIYGFPFMRTYAIMFANQQIFEEQGLSIPTTYDELLSTSETLTERGITTIAVAGQEMWPLMFHYATLALREVGPEEVRSALSGQSSFQQEGFIEAGYRLLELKRAGAFGEDCLSQALDPTAEGFKAGGAALYYHGSWATGGFTADIPIAGRIVPCVYPGVGGPYDHTFLGGAVDCWMASASTRYPDEAARSIILLAQTISTIGGQTGMALPMWESVRDISVQIPGQTEENYAPVKQIYDQIVALTDGVGQEESVLWWDTFLGIKGARCNELIVQMFNEELNPEEFTFLMDALVTSD